MIAHSPSRRTSTAIGSIGSRQGHLRSPGSSSRWRDQRQRGQWFRWRVPNAAALTGDRQCTQLKSESGRDFWDMGDRPGGMWAQGIAAA